MERLLGGPPERRDMLARFARLAARAAGTECAEAGSGVDIAAVGMCYGLPARDDAGCWFAAMAAAQLGAIMVHDLKAAEHADHPLVAGDTGLRFMATVVVRAETGEAIGYLCVTDRRERLGLSPGQAAALRDVAALLGAALAWEARHIDLVEITNRAMRADRMLRAVSEAASCADALTRMLQELCEHHEAQIGRIWRLTDDGMMQEVSRYNGTANDSQAYYLAPPTTPVRSGNSKTAEAIRSNEPNAFHYSAVPDQHNYALMAAAISAGLQSQVSYPIWVQDQRFGVALAFTSERTDLDEIVTDIASLANSIRPALFRKVTEERIRHMALHDDLTQLGNRAVLNEQLALAVTQAQLSGKPAGKLSGKQSGKPSGESGLALLYLDLDGFKLVNDTRGHDVGDKLLTAVAGRLRASVRDTDTLARIGGDEFAIIHPAAGQPYAATQLARRLLQAIAEPFEIDGQRSAVGMSVGIALYPMDGETPDALQRNADAALYEAKQSGRNTFRLFEASVGVLQRERRSLERDLKLAIDREELSLAYQPVVEAQSLRLRGFEALLRWTHRTRGPLSPAQFVPLAESSGLIVPLGHWVLRAACQAAATWQLEGGPSDDTAPGAAQREISLSVNLSPLQFRQEGLPEEIGRALAETGLPARRLDLEITEGLLLADSAAVLRTMHALREQGVRMTLDDFGTAYSGLGYLRRFPFDRLKIDRSFIQDMVRDGVRDGPTTAIVEAILSLSARLGLEVVAEGVETEAQLAMLREMGCDLVQGFHVGRPMAWADAAGYGGMLRVSG